MIAKRGSVEAEKNGSMDQASSEQKTEVVATYAALAKSRDRRATKNGAEWPRMKDVRDMVDWLRAPATIYIGLAGVPVSSLENDC
jgi:hypothetical protein